MANSKVTFDSMDKLAQFCAKMVPLGIIFEAKEVETHAGNFVYEIIFTGAY